MTEEQTQVCLNLMPPKPASLSAQAIISPFSVVQFLKLQFAHTRQCQRVLPAFLSTPSRFLGFLPGGEQRRQHGAPGASLSSLVLGTKWLGF